MTPKQYEAALKKVELSKIKARPLFDSDGRTGQRWVTAGQPGSVAPMLQLMLQFKMSAADVEAVFDPEKSGT